MRVETVSFVTRVRLPNGKHETTISMQNQHQKLSYEVTCDTKAGIIAVKSIKSPSWAVLIPLSNCTFIVLAKGAVASRKAKRSQPRVTTEEAPMTPVVKRNGRQRAQKRE